VATERSAISCKTYTERGSKIGNLAKLAPGFFIKRLRRRRMRSTQRYQVSKDPKFDEWLDAQSARTQVQIYKYKRLSKIEQYGHFGDRKSVSDYETGYLKNTVWELRWNDGKGVYYAYIPEKRILLLLGGNKNGQDKDIAQAKNIFIKASNISQKKKR
jgi:putative addiction module killer protein